MRSRNVFGALAAFVVVGAPMALYAWHVLSEVLSGRFEPLPVAFAVLLLGSFAGAAWRLGRFLEAQDAGAR